MIDGSQSSGVSLRALPAGPSPEFRSTWKSKASCGKVAFGTDLLFDPTLGPNQENSDLVADPTTNFVVIMKDGRIFKNTLK